MALKYRLIQKRNLGEDQASVPQKTYAQMVCGDYVPFEELVEEIQDSTVAGSAGVKAVVRPSGGRRWCATCAKRPPGVRRGNWGTFRFEFRVRGGVENAARFQGGFDFGNRACGSIPGKALRNMKSQANFERVDLVEVDVPSDGGEEEEERPGGL